jgi:hypothetical protein
MHIFRLVDDKKHSNRTGQKGHYIQKGAAKRAIKFRKDLSKGPVTRSKRTVQKGLLREGPLC